MVDLNGSGLNKIGIYSLSVVEESLRLTTGLASSLKAILLAERATTAPAITFQFQAERKDGLSPLLKELSWNSYPRT